MIYSLESVSKFYRQGERHVSALKDINLSVAPGERIALLGPSGAGKSTLFRLLNATVRPSSGGVVFEGRDVAEMSGAEVRGMRYRIASIYQQHNLVPSLTALENTLCGGLGRWSLAHTIRGMIRPRPTDSRKALDALERVGLADKRGARADELSGGQQQRVAIARALMQEAEVILADEPIASLDPGLADEIISLLIRITEVGNRTLIVSLHRVDLALGCFARAVALRAGRIEFDAPSSEVHGDRLKRLYGASYLVEARPAQGRGLGPDLNCV